ncbi:hypothetical protein K461DRAFT_264246 [Myriangium duriaei CBS 260.36]|uniref:Uncharacterized protein n=1 Tax=Myriangium duriaei CBS 260.36 TaxID=1168546 RepID=A0A9P4JCV7_9PEZI|nr:hypothetical protein K461DRAFT_264246 [Myriangium duriaei CBS 260.36]
MAIFSKGKKAPQSTTPTEPTAPVKRVMYVPKYAVRDAMQCTPNGPKFEHREALRKAHEERAMREEYEKSMHHYALSNPKLTVSRNSSAPTTPFEGSRASSSRVINSFASSSSSSLSIPSLVHTSPAVPTIPEQYSASTSSAGPSTPSLSRSSSYHTRPQILSRDAHLHVPSASRSSSGSLTSPSAFMSKTAFRMSIGSSQTWPALTAMLGDTPWELPEEVVDLNTSDMSDVSTRSDSTGDAEILEIAPRFDSTQTSPTIPDTDRFYPQDPRKLGKAPVITSLEVTEAATPPPRKYFTHATRPAATPVATPVVPEKKPRFSLIRRSNIVSAH